MRIKEKASASNLDVIKKEIERIVDIHYKFSYTPIDPCVYKKTRERLVSDLIRKIIEPLLFHRRVVENGDEVKTWPKWKQDIVISAFAARTRQFVKRNVRSGKGGVR